MQADFDVGSPLWTAVITSANDEATSQPQVTISTESNKASVVQTRTEPVGPPGRTWAEVQKVETSDALEQTGDYSYYTAVVLMVAFFVLIFAGFAKALYEAGKKQ